MNRDRERIGKQFVMFLEIVADAIGRAICSCLNSVDDIILLGRKFLVVVSDAGDIDNTMVWSGAFEVRDKV